MRDEIQRNRLQLPENVRFEDFLRQFVGIGALRPQTYWVQNFEGKVQLDFIGKFEDVEADFKRLMNTCPSPDLTAA